MFHKIFVFFDKLEDKIRAKLSNYVIIYAFIGGLGIVLFWRGVWITADMLATSGSFFSFLFNGPITIVWTVLILLATGLFVSFFVGDRIILSGIKHEKKLEEKTVEDLKNEEKEINKVNEKIDLIYKDIEEIKDVISKK